MTVHCSLANIAFRLTLSIAPLRVLPVHKRRNLDKMNLMQNIHLIVCKQKEIKCKPRILSLPPTFNKIIYINTNGR